MSGSLKPLRPGGEASGATVAHSSGRNPATRLTPPIVVRGSRSEATRATAEAGSTELVRSSSRYPCEAVPSARMPGWGDAISQLARPARPGPSVQHALPALRDAAGRARHGLIIRVMPRWRQLRTVEVVAGRVVVEPVLARLEALGDRVPLGRGVVA